MAGKAATPTGTTMLRRISTTTTAITIMATTTAMAAIATDGVGTIITPTAR